MIYFLIGAILGLIVGAFLGGFIVFQFNVPDYTIGGKYKAKKGSEINLENLIKGEKKRKFKLFKLK